MFSLLLKWEKLQSYFMVIFDHQQAKGMKVWALTAEWSGALASDYEVTGSNPILENISGRLGSLAWK